MPKITIGTDVINFPDNGSDALWSPAVIQFAEIVADQLATVSNTNNILPTVLALPDNNISDTYSILSFNPSIVRKFSLNYSIYRKSTTTSTVEAGLFTGSYDSNLNVWIFQDEYFGDKKTDGTSYHNFSMSGNTVQLETKQIAGIYDSSVSKLSYSARTEVVSI